MVTILDPTNETMPVERQVSARSGALTGTIGMLDISKPRGNVLLDELERLIGERAPDVTVRRYRKPTFAKPCPDPLRAQIREECDLVIEGLAD